MENVDIKYIHCEELEIAAGCESDISKETTVYQANSYLIYVEQGQLHIRIDQQFYVVSKGEFALVRKYTKATVYKSFTKEEAAAKTYFFALTNEFIRKIIGRIKIPGNLSPIADRIVPLQANSQLLSLMQSIIAYVDKGDDLDPKLVESKTKEALLAIIKSDAKLAVIFREYSMAERADMVEFINHNYLINCPLETMAKQSGRSLSTFNREFKIIFNETPHQWILKKRLSYARNLLLQGEQKASDIYLEAGFEDLAHFSRSFKKQFGIPPSKVQALT